MLLGIGLALFALEPFVPSHGLLTVGGLLAFVVGGSVLYNQAGPGAPDVRVALPILITAGVAGAAFGLLITTMAIRTRRMASPRHSPAGIRPDRDRRRGSPAAEAARIDPRRSARNGRPERPTNSPSSGARRFASSGRMG